MQTFNIRDLQQRTTELVRDAEAGSLSLVTEHGRPVLIALPVTQRLLEAGVFEALAVKLYQDEVLSMSKAAQLAGIPMERFVEALAAAGVEAVSYSAEELYD